MKTLILTLIFTYIRPNPLFKFVCVHLRGLAQLSPFSWNAKIYFYLSLSRSFMFSGKKFLCTK